MISVDVKSNIKQQEIKDLVAASYKLLEEVPSKQGGLGEGGGLHNGQNPLSVTKVVYRQSLSL